MGAPSFYLPILKGKAGELLALKNLERRVIDRLCPCFDIPAPPIQSKRKVPEKPEEYLTRKLRELRAVWAADRRCFLDLFDTPLTTRTTEGSHYITHLALAASQLRLKPILVTGLDRDSAHHQAVKAAIADGRSEGACIRIQRSDMAGVQNLASSLRGLLVSLGIARGHSDLIFDLRQIAPDEEDGLADTVTKVLLGLGGIAEWRTVAIAGTGMPESLRTFVPAETVGDVIRRERTLWTLLQERRPKRPLVFADYGVVHPDMPDLDPQSVNMAPAVRYAADDRWIVFRGRGWKNHPDGFGQYRGLAANCTRHNAFMGSGYSWGDRYIQDCAGGRKPTSNPQRWIAVGTNHHLTYVSEELN